MSLSKNRIIGVDVGGTKIMAGVMTAEGKIVGEPFTTTTRGSDAKEVIIDRIANSIEEAVNRAKITFNDVIGIGLGVTGPLDMEKGLVLECPQLPTLHHFPLRQAIQDHYQIPVHFDNDANSLILGESYFGAGSKFDIILGFTLGTGLGCAIIINKKPFWGATQTAGEVWPSSYRDETIEDYVSGKGISRIFKDHGGNEKSAKEISELAQSGDEIALKTWHTFGEGLAHAISWGVNIIDPHIIILGGSIAKAMPLFFPAMDAYFRKHICPVPAQRTKIVKAGLGDYAGVIGAACVVLQKIKHQV